MLGTNKTWSISRFNGTTYQVVGSFRFRYQPNKSKSEGSYRLSQDHIEFRLFSDLTDIASWDRLTENWKTWTIIGIDPYWDQMWKHIEVTMRERNSSIHQDVVIKKPAGTQPEYDVVLHEYKDPSSDIVYIDTSYKALVDESWIHKERWINVIGAGKYESISYVMTLEIDEPVEIEDKVQLPDGEVYLVDWKYTLPYQVMYWLKKTFKNNSYNV